MRLRPPLLLLAAATTAAAVVATAGPAAAHPGPRQPHVTVLDRTVGAPFQLTTAHGSLYVADGATATVSKLTRHGLVAVAHGPQPGEVAGVAVNGKGDLAYTSTDYTTGATALTIKPRHGKTVVADLATFERTRNPDRRVSYGIDHPTPCQVEAFASLGGAKYTGLVDSHPYSVAALPGGAWVVGDAGGNDLLKVDHRGRISVLSVLPRQPVRISASGAAALGLPDCVIGAVYNFEPVPTDVEVAANGRLVVSLLPGGPEDPSLGARGAVVSVNPRTGHATRLAGGFNGATNVALDGRGRIFVSELFGGQISVIEHGRVRPYVQIASPLGLTFARGTLYAGTLGPTDGEGNPTGPGTLVAIR
ncbi:MAG TPA: ScyD/ScyE family protein [Mycobacteriales bacterium]|nr:ScyD/ScyE family protein [Mycobacteriales bacterium]